MKTSPNPYLSVNRILTLAFLFGTLFAASQLSAQEMTLRLTDVTPSSSMAGVRGPAVLFLEFDGGSAVTAKVMIPYDVASGDYQGNTAVFDLNAAGLSLAGSSLSGTASATVRAAGSGSTYSLSLSLTGSISGGTVSGSYTGTAGGSAIAGDITGETMNETPATSDVKLSLSLFQGELSTPSGVRTVGPNNLRAWFEFSGGALVDFEASSGHYAASLFTPDDPRVVRLIGPRGDLDYGLVRVFNVASASAGSASLSADAFTTAFSVTYLDDELTGQTFDYVLTGHVIGTTVCGTYSVSEGGSTLKSDGSFIGYLGSGDPVAAEALPLLTPLEAAADNENSGFTPPYFAGIGAPEMRERIKAAALWLTDSPEISVFASEAAGTNVGSTGNKQYDNAPFSSYGGAVGFGVLHDLTSDADLQAFTREAAARAGYWIDAMGTGNYQGLAGYYKGMFFVSVWAPLAHMDLYETFGDQRWLDAVTGYMAFLENEVTNRMNGPEIWDPAPDDGVPAGRTWVMMQNDGGDIGVSNRRYIRDYDDMELHPAEFLWLLGKLRVDHGINTFATFEANAYQWMVDNINDADMWKYRPEGPRNEPQAVGPTFFALYMLDYAPSYDPAILTQVVDHVESVHIGWGHPVSDDGLTETFAPYVRDFYPRQSSGYLNKNVPSTAATSRMALVYLKRYEAQGDPADLAKSKALALSVLNRQKLTNGMIHHLGVTAFSEDHQIRLIDGPNGTPPDVFGNPDGRLDQHPYTGLKANTLRNLLDFVELLESLGEDCSNPQAITVTTPIQKAVSDPPFALTATATSGLPVQYELVYGPASLAGDTVTLDGTEGIVKLIASQPGDATWCEAASKSVFIAVGDQTPATPGAPAASGTDVTTVEVSWTDTSDNETYFRIEYREQGAGTWSVAGTTGADTISFTVEGLTTGVTYEFRVFAVNQVAESAASNTATGAPLEDAVFLFAEFECVPGIGPGWSFQNNAQAGGGVELYATADQRQREVIDPATITDIFFDIPVAATYALWVRGYTTEGGASDSIWLKVDDGIHIGTGSDTFYGQAIFNAGYYGWQANNDTFFLTAGQHKVTIAPREDGTVIDRIMLTTSTDFFTSFGIGGEPFNCGTDEAELVMLIRREAGSMQLEFYGEAGYLYQVETTTDLAGPWDQDGDLLYTGQDSTITVPVADPATREFYRIFRIPAP